MSFVGVTIHTKCTIFHIYLPFRCFSFIFVHVANLLIFQRFLLGKYVDFSQAGKLGLMWKKLIWNMRNLRMMMHSGEIIGSSVIWVDARFQFCNFEPYELFLIGINFMKWCKHVTWVFNLLHLSPKHQDDRWSLRSI
jgi:hypothetical protein